MSQEQLEAQAVSPRAIGQAEIEHLFTQLPPLEVEQFYATYQLWQKQQHITQIEKQLEILYAEIVENTRLMQALRPSPIALVALEQLYARDVTDVDILDRVMAQGDPWLDHTIHLLLRCEQLDLIGDDYTQWCNHALDGAYDWLDSIHDNTNEDITATATDDNEILHDHATAATDTTDQVTEDQLLLKLMSEEGEQAEQVPQTPDHKRGRQTQPLVASHEEGTSASDQWPYAYQVIEVDHRDIDSEQEDSEIPSSESDSVSQPDMPPSAESENTSQSDVPSETIPSTIPDAETPDPHNEQEKSIEEHANSAEKPHFEQKQGFLKQLAKILRW